MPNEGTNETKHKGFQFIVYTQIIEEASVFL